MRSAIKTHQNNRECLAARRLAAVILAAIMLGNHVGQFVNPEVGHRRALDIGKNLGYNLFFFAGTLFWTELVLYHEGASLEQSGFRFVFVRRFSECEELCDSFLDVVIHDVYLLFGYKKQELLAPACVIILYGFIFNRSFFRYINRNHLQRISSRAF